MTRSTASFETAQAVIPLAADYQKAQSSSLVGRSPVTILMVDDEPSKLLTYEVILSELGEQLVKVHSGKEALDYLLKSEVAVVLLDVSMPEIDGFELADMMRQHPRFEETPIIFVSGVHLTDVDRLRGYRSGAVDYISVPVVPDVLRAKVSVFAELYRKNRQLQELNRDLERRVAERSQELRALNGQLQERVAQLESIMRVLPVGVAVAHDAQCKVITGNAALCDALGMKLGDNIAKNAGVQHEVYCSGRSIAELPVQKAARTRQATGIIELEIHAEDKSQRSFLASALPLFDEQGDVRGAVGAFFDVTDRKRMEDALRERAELLDLASEAIMVRDSSGAIRFWNAGAEALYGWGREEVIRLNAHELLLTTFPVSMGKISTILSSEGRWEGNLVQRCKDGREVVVASRQVLKMNGALVLEINRDITSQLIAEEALRRSDRLAAMGKVAAMVAHEINNPLEAIMNIFYMLKDHPSLDSDAREYAQLADQELARISHITRQTLGFYRESQSAVEVSVSHLLDDVLALQESWTQVQKISVEKDYRVKGLVQGFPVELKQVFMNLASNAIQAMPAGGRLRVKVAHVTKNDGQSGVQVSISDNGVGINSGDAKHLFEPFFTTKSTKGTGLGLWISRGIVHKHEGTIAFRSVFRSWGASTCFQVYLPMVELDHR